MKELVRPVKTIIVSDIKSIGERTFPGMAKAADEVNLSFRVSGPLISFPAKVGQKVKKGDVVAQIDPRDFDIKIRNAQANLERSKANHGFAKKEYLRILSIRKQDPGATSQKIIDKRKQLLDSAVAEIKAIEASLQGATDDLADSFLRAPLDSTVVAKYVDNFESVNAKQQIVRLIDSSNIDFTVNIPEMLISNLAYVKEIWVEFDAYKGNKIAASIKEVGTEASAITRTYPITLTLKQPQGFSILPGMAGNAAAKAELPDSNSQVGITIPPSAIMSSKDDGKFYVWIVDNASMTVEKRKITTGSFDKYGIVVKSGIKPGETLVTAGANYLRSGQKIKLLTTGK